jgi:hypothetical protein
MDKSIILSLFAIASGFVLIGIVGNYGLPNAVERVCIAGLKWSQKHRSRQQTRSARQYAELCELIPDADPHGLRNLHCIRLNVEDLQENSLVG